MNFDAETSSVSDQSIQKFYETHPRMAAALKNEFNFMLNDETDEGPSSNNLSIDEKKKRRLERNRDSARECRKRKKEKILALRQKINFLEADNLQLRMKLVQVGPESDELIDVNKGANDITSRLGVLVQENGSETDIHNSILELQENFSDYGRNRRSAIDFHMGQLRRCLQPTQTTRAMLWLISCAPMFHDSSGSLKEPQQRGEVASLWYNLLETLKPSKDQISTLVKLAQPLTNTTSGTSTGISSSLLHTGRTSSPDTETSEDIGVETVSHNSERMLDRLDELFSSKNDSLDHEMGEIQGILSATQIAKFILWIDQNPACMQLLEALWPHLAENRDRDI